MSGVHPSGGVLVTIKIVSYDTLDTAVDFWNFSTSEYKTENPAKCNTSTRSRDRDTL